MLPEFASTASPLELRHAATDHAIFVIVPQRRFLAVAGMGSPGAADFALAGGALQLASELLGRRLRGHGLTVPLRPPAPECIWAPTEPLPPADIPAAFSDRSRWQWRQLLELPEAASEADVEAAIDEGRRRAGREAALVRPVVFSEGPVAQWLHLGARTEEPASLASLYAAIAEADLHPDGWLHMVTLSRAQAARRREIIRQPVSPFAHLSIRRPAFDA